MFTRCRLDATAHGSHPRHGLAYGLPSASGAFGGLSPGQRLPASPSTAYRGGRGQGLRLPHVRTRHGPRPATAPGRHRPGPRSRLPLPSTRPPSRPRSRRLPRRRPRHAARLRITPATAPRVFPILDFPRWEHFAAPARRAAPCLDGATAPAVPPGRAAPGRATDHAPRARTCRTWKRCRRSRRLTPRRLTPRCAPTAPGARRLRPRYGPALDGDRYGATATTATPSTAPRARRLRGDPTGGEGRPLVRHRPRRRSPRRAHGSLRATAPDGGGSGLRAPQSGLKESQPWRGGPSAASRRAKRRR